MTVLFLISACMATAPDSHSPSAAASLAGAAAPASEAAAATPRDDSARSDAAFTAADGIRLPLRRWLPKGKLRAAVLALHGFNDYSHAFASAGPAFAARGIATYAYDQRGFGASSQPGHWAGTQALVDDTLAAMRFVRAGHPGVPFYVVGESMGGAVAILAVNRIEPEARPPDGVVLLAPAVWGREAMNIFERAGLWFAGFMPNLHWSLSLIQLRIQASDNIPMLRALHADPLVLKETRADTLNGLVDLMGEALDEAPRFSARSLILYGDNDQIVPRAAVARFVATLPEDAARHQRVAVYPAGYHLLLRDLEGPLVTADVTAWMLAPESPLPAGRDAFGRDRLAGRPMPASITHEDADVAAPPRRTPS